MRTGATSSRLPKWANASSGLLLLVALEALLLLVVFDYANHPLQGDGGDYHLLAHNLLNHGVFSTSEAPPLSPTGLRTPGYPLFVAAIYGLTGESQAAVRVVQFVLLGGMVLLVLSVVSRYLSRGAAIVTALLCATYPPFLGVSLRLLRETVALFLTVLFVHLLCVQRDDQAAGRETGVGLFAAMGAVLGALTFVIPTFALIGLVPAGMLLWSTRDWRRVLPRLFVLGVLFALPVSIWAVRNTTQLGVFVPLSTTGGSTIYYSAVQYTAKITPATVGKTLSDWNQQVADLDERRARALRRAEETDVADPRFLSEVFVGQEMRRDGVAMLRATPITRMILNYPVRMLYFWGPSDIGPWVMTPFHRIAQLEHLALALLAVVGAWMLRAQLWTLWPLLLPAVYLTVIHSFAHVEARYSLQGRPFGLLLAAVPIWEAIRRLHARMGRAASP